MAKTKVEVLAMIALLNRKKFVVIDIETSGLSPSKGGRIIEIGAVKIVDGKIVDRFEYLINPEQKIYAKTIELTGITNEMLEGKPVIGQILPLLYEFMEDAVIVCHNAMFDWDRFLLYFFKNVGISPKNEVADTLVLSKHFFPNDKDKNRKYTLDVMCTELGVILDEHHRAFADAKATGEILLELTKRFKDQIEQLANFEIKAEPKVEAYQQSLMDDLFSVPDTDTETKKKEPLLQETNEDKLNIRKVRYWEKPINKQKSYRRLYININDRSLYGTVYFDIPTKAWYNKDFSGVLDFNRVQILVLKFLNLKTVEELCGFRN